MTKVSPIQSNFNGGEISPLLYGRPDIDKYATGLKTCKNFVPLVQGPVERRPGSMFVAEVKDSSKSTRVVRFEFSTTQAYILEFGDLYIRFYKDRAGIGSGPFAPVFATEFDIFSALELVTTYAEADLFQLKFAQSADTLYITHPSYPPRKLERFSDISWTITDITFLDGPFLNTNATTTTFLLSGLTGSVTVTASAITGINNDTGFASTDVGRLIRWKDPAGDWTWLTITAFTSTTIVTATIDGPDASAGTATVNWRLGVWSVTTGYPAAVTFHQDRLGFGGGVDFPQRTDLSRTGDFENFAPTEVDGTVVDDNAITNTLAADNVNSIRWLADDEKGLLIGTVGGEWVMRPSDTGGVLTPTNVQAKRSTSYGSADIQALRAGRSMLFVPPAKRKLREMAYTFEDDGFRSPDLTLVAEHVTRTGMIELAYQREPQSIVWTPLVDGTLLGLTYEREQDIIGWHRHILGGFSDSGDTVQAKVESVAVIPNMDGTADEVYVVVNRHINGGTKRYIEYLKPFWEDSNDQEDAFFVDSGLTYDGVPATQLSGLDHLEGEEVAILSEGAVLPNETVSAGSITIDKATTKAQVGKAYDSDVETLRPEAGAQDGTAQGKLQRMHRVITRFFQTLGGKIGPDEDNLDTLVFRAGGDAMDTAVPLFDGDVEIEWDAEYSSDTHIFYRQDQPLPTTIQAFMPQMSTQDR